METWVPVLVGFALAFIATPAGVSGAFLLVPYLVSVVGIASPSASATSLLFNTFSTPGGIYRFGRQGALNWKLSRLVIAGTVPGVIVGAVLRVNVFETPQTFKAFMGVILLLLALKMWFEIANVVVPRKRPFSARLVMGVAVIVGVISGIYGTGGGSLMAPFLVAVMGLSVMSVRGATLTSTFITSIAGSIAFFILGTHARWDLAVLFGIGGACGSYLGARAKRFVSERIVKGLLAVLASLLGINYVLQGLGII
ncbi:MAG: uncharacterized protein QOH90_604 [Actinomycetota bacterium]|nr:uncharacterized protein [Actinomycetota bacterium]